MLCSLSRVAVSAVSHHSQAYTWLTSSRSALASRTPHAAASHSFNRGLYPRALRQLCTAAGSGGKPGSNSSSAGSKTESSKADSNAHSSKTPGVDASLQESQEGGGDEPQKSASEFEEQEKESEQTYRQIMRTWIASREVDLRGLAAESSLAVRDFLADPSVNLFGREYTMAKLKEAATIDFDLRKFTGSFKRVADLTAWYPPAQQGTEDTETADSVPPAEAWTKKDGQHPAAIAFQNNSLSFGFSAGGLLFSYYIGVVFGLHDLGVITRDTQIGGSSAGSLIAACYHSGLPQDVIIANCAKLAEDCRTNGTRGRLGLVLEKFLEELLPEDIHERCNNRAFVAVSRVWPRPTPVLVSEYTSRDDLISALMTSCHVPLWFDSRPWTTFRGSASYDGGLTNFIPIPPADYGVRICCFPSKQLNSVYEIQISPDSFTDWRHGMTQMVSWAFEPADEQMLDQFIAKGRADAKAWAEECGILELISKSQQPDPDGVEEGAEQKSRMSPTKGSPETANT